jgi:hypothetical protein
MVLMSIFLPYFYLDPNNSVTVASISAKDFDLRLSQLSRSQDAGEFAEISTSIIGQRATDFEEITGWYHDTDSLKREVLKKRLNLMEILLRLPCPQKTIKYQR